MQLVSDRIEVSDPLEAIEYCYRQNMTDGLPVVPPTERRVAEFLAHVGLSPGEEIAEVTERARVITTEKLAINQKYEFSEIYFTKKTFIGNAAPREIIDDLVSRVDAAIVGVGD